MNNEILGWLNNDSKEYLCIGTIVDDENKCLQNYTNWISQFDNSKRPSTT